LDGFWSGRVCLITGVDGFLGAHLAKRLVSKGSTVVGVSHQSRRVSTLTILGVEDQIEHITGFDVADYTQVKRALESHTIDTCFHLAAISTLPEATTSPLQALETNVRGTWNILEAARLTGSVRGLVIASSDKAYGDHADRLPYQETAALRPIHLYDVSKACVDLISQTYFFQFGVPLKITRCTNIYGPADLNLSRLIPGTIMRGLSGRPPLIHAGQAETTREFLHVDDAVDAYLVLARSLQVEPSESPKTEATSGAEAFSYCAHNVGGGQQNVKTVREVVAAIGRMIGERAAVPVTSPQRWPPVLDIPKQAADSSKMRSVSNWRPKWNLIPDGLERTIAWYKAHKESILRLAGDVLTG